MFGFFAPQQQFPEWRRSYARICQYQRKLFGLMSLPFLSYEAAFLYQVSIDLHLLPKLPSTSPECCRLRKLKTTVSDSENAAARYAAALGMLLAGVKLQDDVHDSGRILSRILEWKYRAQVRLAERFLTAHDATVISEVQDSLRLHSQLETSQHRISIEQYSVPAGNGFASAFAGISSGLQSALAEESFDRLAEVGRRAGQAIIAWDCAVDFDRDRITGNYNPLSDDIALSEAFSFCLLQLAEIGWSLPENSASRAVVASVAARVRRRSLQPAAQHPLRLLERWGLIRERGFAYARCDGCEALCAVGECSECFCQSGECFTMGNICPCDACFWTDCRKSNDRPGVARKSDRDSDAAEAKVEAPESPYVEYLGRQAVVVSNLNPSGYVMIEQSRLPARSESGMYIEADATVRIVRVDLFGVFVAIN